MALVEDCSHSSLDNAIRSSDRNQWGAVASTTGEIWETEGTAPIAASFPKIENRCEDEHD